MKLLLDTCVWGKARFELIDRGHDVVWVGTWDEDPGDAAILAHAHGQARALVTLDKDFGELAIHRGTPHHGILRLVDIPARLQAKACLDVIERFGEELLRGAIITVTTERIRIRPPDSSTTDEG